VLEKPASSGADAPGSSAPRGGRASCCCGP